MTEMSKNNNQNWQQNDLSIKLLNNKDTKVY